jgi:hypothetical protein
MPIVRTMRRSTPRSERPKAASPSTPRLVAETAQRDLGRHTELRGPRVDIRGEWVCSPAILVREIGHAFPAQRPVGEASQDLRNR